MSSVPALDDLTIGVVGLGYVGLPLAVELGKHYSTVAYDINPERIRELEDGFDRTREVPQEELESAGRLRFSSNEADLAVCSAYVVTVPTPIDRFKQPELGPLIAATEIVGSQLSPGNVVIYESTVYPGATEDVCAPILEVRSGLTLNDDFFLGYSPERINPGDRKHRLGDIKKVTAGSTRDAARFVDALYGSIIAAGTFPVDSIRVAEAAKVIENTQRDVNIALVNEFALIFNKLGIDTNAVLEAAGTKWNFLPFRPGLVGGHCIGVDPYYLTYKAQAVGYQPEVILAGRRINDGMGRYVANRVVKLMIARGIDVAGAQTLILGLTFKENCPDIRNTRVIDIVGELKSFNANVTVFDPLADTDEAKKDYGVDLAQAPVKGSYDAIILAVPHQEFVEMGASDIRELGKPEAVLYDVKGVLDHALVDERL